MKRIGMMSLVAGALSAAVIGFAGPAQADQTGFGFGGYGYGHHGYGYGYGNDDYPWIHQLFPTVKVPHVSTTVHP
ncbi:hypothetical protein [Mycolicibacterium psychrotolerans]|uniref:Sulfur globule protein n=1 Tax=Mycolicibacterium psychrotolerans TaxID=216929 RepID=A0A7I7M5N4_9MYCO|nr:hypothetical protein [Mycolicibacterium psychrotolerans]KRE27167.1 hypothetical protein ASG82_11970 [Mycobacterium sp. Soil538]BBX67511.1 hypothetical protein MPSYJ_09720 [Mycolicibacterium psychrotolerans]